MWTPSQQMAIDAHCADNLVSAAAGSGKTAVMVERIVSRILTGKIDIDKILVVTFTNAAASEMKTRLISGIMDCLDTTDDPDRLNRQLVLINNAAISTIDSFCLNILRNNFFKLNLDPGFKIADPGELELIKSDILDEVFNEYYASEDAVFLNLVDCYSTKNDRDLFELILKVFLYTNSMPKGVFELDDMLTKFKDRAVWEEYFTQKAHRLIDRAIGYYDVALECCDGIIDFDKVVSVLSLERSGYAHAKKARNWDELRHLVSKIEFATLSFPRGTTDAEKNPIKAPREEGKKLKAEIEKMLSEDTDTLSHDCDLTYASLEKLVEITHRFADRFAQAKLKSGVVDFADVEQMTIKLLEDENGSPSELAMELMKKYDEIYVDEYQDCNAVQEKLFALISRANMGNPNVFMVGDMKQSIYSFRGSEPKYFKAKADTYRPYSDDGSYNKIVLSKNFRSRKTIIDAVNHIFSQIMSLDCGGLDYTEEEYLYYNEGLYEDVNEDVSKVDFVLMETDSNLSPDDAPDTVEEIKKTQAEAIYVANKINEIVCGKEPYLVFDKRTKAYRRAQYSDITVLLRSGKDKVNIFDRVLSAAQIPVYCETGEAFFDTLEISFIISFLKIIDNPYDDIALLSVMRHPVFAFDEDDFVSIRLCKTKGYLYSSVKEYLLRFTDELSSRLKSFTDVLTSFYKRSRYLSADKLIWEIVRDTDYMSYLSFLPNSELKKANVKALISRAYDFEKTSYKGIFDFIRYIDSLGKNNKSAETAKTLSDDENVVRIMSIHKSKGLEFPIVFLCDAAKQFNETDINASKLLMHRECGFGCNFYDSEKKYYYELPQKKMLKDVIKGEMLSEEMRILYVALTRAREKLFVVGSVRNLGSKISKLSAKLIHEDYRLSGEVAASSKSLADWILLALLRDKTSSLYDRNMCYRNPVDSGGIFRVTLLHKNSGILNVNAQDFDREFEGFSLGASGSEKIEKILDFQYPFKALSDIPSNMSVTELKRRENEDDVYEFYKTTKLITPKFCDGGFVMTPAEIGTLTHLVMEKLDFSKTDTAEDIKRQIEKLVIDGFMTSAQAEFIKIDNIVRIFKSDIGNSLKKQQHTVKREFSFKYLMSVAETHKEVHSDEKIVIQGTIDIFFEDENGEIIIADYKTDVVKNNVEEIKKRYSPQLKYYKIALTRALGKKVSKAYLFLLDTGESVEC